MPRPRPSIEVRPIRDDELVPWFEAFTTTFYIWHNADPAALAEVRRPTFDTERAIAALDGPQIVGTFRSFSTELTLPGGSHVGVNAVTGVSVRPTHRRRGILRALASDDLARATDRGDAASILIASEWPIYGRFGYGPATWAAQWVVRTRDARFTVEPGGTIEIVDLQAARRLLPEIFELHRLRRAGEIERPPERWDFDLGLVEWPGRPRWRGSVAVHRDAEGHPDGYARYHGEEKWDEGIPDNVLILDELLAGSDDAELALWQYLTRMDLTATIRAGNRRAAEPLRWVLADARAARLKSLDDHLWIRPLDVPRLLSNRTYESTAELVLEVVDGGADGGTGPAAGRYRLEAGPAGASCRRTDASPDVGVDVRALGAALLGGTRLVDASRTPGAAEHRPGALASLDRLLRTADEPWCTTWF